MPTTARATPTCPPPPLRRVPRVVVSLWWRLSPRTPALALPYRPAVARSGLLSPPFFPLCPPLSNLPCAQCRQCCLQPSPPSPVMVNFGTRTHTSMSCPNAATRAPPNRPIHRQYQPKPHFFRCYNVATPLLPRCYPAATRCYTPLTLSPCHPVTLSPTPPHAS